MFKVGDKVEYKGDHFIVLGFAASEDEKGKKLIEISWNDYGHSPTGYLAVPEKMLKKTKVPEKNTDK